MKKFTSLNESVKNVETSTNKKDFILNLIEETLKIENGVIMGKELLSKTLNKILEINDSKTTIKVLENVKAASFRSLNFQWINEAIEEEKKKMKKDDDCVDCDNEYDEEEMSDDTLECGDEKMDDLNESKKVKFEVEVELCDDEEKENGKENSEEIEKFDDFVFPEEDEEGVFVQERFSEFSDLYRLMESIKPVYEHHLETKPEQIKFIESNMNDKGVEKLVYDKLGELPEFNDIDGEHNKKVAINKVGFKKVMNNLSDGEVEELYKSVESELGIS